MEMSLILIVILQLMVSRSFKIIPVVNRHTVSSLSMSSSSSSSSSSNSNNQNPSESVSWQANFDKLLDIDTSCDERKELVLELATKSSVILDDVKSAVEKRDVQVIAPKDLQYGKNIEGIQAVNRQIVSDLIPALLRNGPPRVNFESISKAVSDAPKIAKSIAEKITELSKDNLALQNTVDEVWREVKNAVKPIPSGLQTLKYEVISRNSNEVNTEKPLYEIRRYEPYAVCKYDAEGEMDSGKSFNALADYIFGEGKMLMTTPVITEKSDDGRSESIRMSFILSDGKTVKDAPQPTDARVVISDIAREVVAYMEFPGIATEKEVTMQSTVLENLLLDDQVQFEKGSLKIFQYNSPFTLPWVRTNAVTFRVNLAIGND